LKNPFANAIDPAGVDCGVKLTLNTVNHRDGAIYCQSHKPYDKPTGGLRTGY
jgi:hypothetical protein